MTHHEFRKLTFQEQAEVINKYGVFVSERILAGNRLYLYLVNYFYVELFHELSSLENKGIVISNVFEDAWQLAVYQHSQSGKHLFSVSKNKSLSEYWQ